jgi:tRNA-binding protein
MQEYSSDYQIIQFSDFLKVEMRVGTIMSAELNIKAIKPAYILKINFGEIGFKTSSDQITENYTIEELVDMQIVAVMNFEPKKVAGVKSEVLVLASVSDENGTILLKPSLPAPNGSFVL